MGAVEIIRPDDLKGVPKVDSHEKINMDELSLPPYLVRLLSEGRWKTPPNPNLLRELTQTLYTDFKLLTTPVRLNSYTHLYTDPRTANTYGLASANQMGNKILDPQILDVDKAILLATNWDDEAICLDYRPNFEAPTVVACIWSPDDLSAPLRWKKLANNIKAFADYLGL